MIRTMLTMISLVLGTIVFAGLAVIIGLIHPTRRGWAFVSRGWARTLLVPAGVRLQIDGHEHVSDNIPRLFVGNHQSALDIPILFQALGGDVRFMAKESLFRIPLFGWALSVNRFISIDRTDPRSAAKQLKKAMERLRRDPVSLALFPEGTRSTDGRLLPFRRGAIKICRRSGMAVVPFAIDGAFKVLNRTGYRVTPGTVRIVFAQPITAEEVASMTPSELHDRIRGAVGVALGQPSDAPRLDDVSEALESASTATENIGQ